MDQETPIPWRACVPALLIQVLAFCITTGPDGGISHEACLLASLPYWIGAVSILVWRRGRLSRLERQFVRWGLLPFVVVGTPILYHFAFWRLFYPAG
jgi:hypothetical protein